MSGRLLALVVHPWSVKLGMVQIDQILTLRWECADCKTVYAHNGTAATRFSLNQVEFDLEKLGPVFCHPCNNKVSFKFHGY